MEKIRVIRGNGNITREKVNILLESAIEFYGSKYEDIILDVVRNTIFYEMRPEEKMKQAIKNIGDGNLKMKGRTPKACQFTLRKNQPKEATEFIIWKPQNDDSDYHILAHELFGHAICGKKNPLIENIYIRNGIALHNVKTGEDRYNLLNEGFMEYISSSIISLNKKQINDIASHKFYLATKCSEYISKELGKEKILDNLVLYKGSIEAEYNAGSNINELLRLDRILEIESRLRNIHSKCQNSCIKKIDKELKKFKERKQVVR